jgi:hypothetical protein
MTIVIKPMVEKNPGHSTQERSHSLLVYFQDKLFYTVCSYGNTISFLPSIYGRTTNFLPSIL